MIDFLFHYMVYIAIAGILFLVIDSFTIRLFASQQTTESTQEYTQEYTQESTQESTQKSTQESTEEVETEVEGAALTEVETEVEAEVLTEVETKVEGEEETEEKEYESLNIRDLRDWIYKKALQEEVRALTKKKIGKLRKQEMVEALNYLHQQS